MPSSVFLVAACALTVWTLASTSAMSSNESCPSSCFCDEVGDFVSCFGEGLWELPTELPKSTSRLELRNYVIPTLTYANLLGLTELRELGVQQARIGSVEGGAFVHLTRLVRLDLGQNEIENVTTEVFDGLVGLRNLDLSNNWLANIDEAFRQLIFVEQLNLRANHLTQLTGKSFVGLQKVVYLNLDTNSVSTIEVDAFQYLVNLAHLIISNNPLKTLSRLDFFGSRLQFIDISNISLLRVPQSLTRFVRDLRLAKNNLTRVSAGDFESYPYLGLLVLDDNAIEEIENDALGRQEHLVRLWLNGNRLTRVPVNLPPSLRALYLEENQLQNLHAYSFRGLYNLEQLFLQRNRIANLSACSFCDLVNLTSLDLQANQIEHLVDGVFSNLTKLRVLDISQNNLRTMGGRCLTGLDGLNILQMSRMASSIEFDETLFDPLKNLQTLEMYDSAAFTQAVVSSSRILHGLRRIQELNIMHNKLVNLRPDFPSFFPLLKVIKMSGNSWHCSQNITWLANWIKMSNVQFYRSYSIRCASPQGLYYKPIMLLNEDDFKEPTTDTYDTSITSITEKTTTELDREQTESDEAKATSMSTTLTMHSSGTTNFDLSTLSNLTEVLLPNETDTTTPLPPDQDTTTFTSPTLYNTTIINEEITLTPTGQIIEQSSPDITSTSFADDITHVLANITELPLEGKNQRLNRNRNASQPQVQRFYISALGGRAPTPTVQHWNQMTAITLSTALAGGCLIIMTATVVLFTIYKCRIRCQRSGKMCSIRRSSSISYHPQRDEVSIMTVSEGTVGWKTSTHHGLGNKLYYALENVDIMNDSSTASLVANPL